MASNVSPMVATTSSISSDLMKASPELTCATVTSFSFIPLTILDSVVSPFSSWMNLFIPPRGLYPVSSGLYCFFSFLTWRLVRLCSRQRSAACAVSVSVTRFLPARAASARAACAVEMAPLHPFTPIALQILAMLRICFWDMCTCGRSFLAALTALACSLSSAAKSLLSENVPS